MSEVKLLPPPVVELAPRSKWEREYRAFQRHLPKLIATHRGLYVAVHDEHVVDCGEDRLALASRVLAKVGNVAIHIGRVSDQPEPAARSGVRRQLPVPGDGT